MTEKRLPEETLQKIQDYVTENFPNQDTFEYRITDDGKEIRFSTKEESDDSDKIYEGIHFMENLLNAEFQGLSNINNVYYFIYKFKE